ncbi:MAG: hypothetical protein JXR96_16860 [Deltaproteobacteria bacterium]|nr:hypothetical protein [Deltaproteobacteria bacterium]
MLGFCEQVVIAHPIERVYSTLRDRLAELVAYTPALESVETLERSEPEPGRVHLVNRWQANRSAAPKIVRPFMTRSLLSWKDVAEWDQASWSTRWRFETFHFDKLFDCEGHNCYEEVEGGTRFTMNGSLSVYPERMPGVPRTMAKRLGPRVERFILKLVRPNLTALIHGLQGFLDQAD